MVLLLMRVAYKVLCDIALGVEVRSSVAYEVGWAVDEEILLLM